MAEYAFNEVEFQESRLLTKPGEAAILFLTSGPPMGFSLTLETVAKIRTVLDEAQLFLTRPAGTS